MAALSIIKAVELLNMIRFSVDVDALWGLLLHPVCEFEAFDTGGKLSVCIDTVEVLAVNLVKELELGKLLRLTEACNSLQIRYGVTLGVDPCPLKGSWEKSVSPVRSMALGQASPFWIAHDHEGRKVFILGA
tara:strand:+ start:1630 stop:2025 length:396 start_codon:yes stop_codon:yes gene_type:complete